MAGEAMACVCAASTPQERMARADVAFFGRVTAIRDEGRERVYTVAVERVFKGDVGATTEVRGDNPNGYGITSCSETLRVGQRFGIFGRSVNACSLATLDQLEQGAAGYPEPTGAGRAVALLTGPFGNASFAALDRRGRVIAYARGTSRTPVTLSQCPRARFVVESSDDGIRTRRLADLRAVRRLFARPAPSQCTDSRGRTAVALRGSRLVRIRGGKARTLFRGASGAFDLGTRRSVVVTRRDVRTVDNRSGRSRRIRGGRARVVALAPSERAVAVLSSNRVTLYDLRGRRRSSARVDANTSDLEFAPDGRLITIRQATPRAVVVDGALWWVSGGHLRRAPLRGGAVTTLATVPDAPSFLLALEPRRTVRDRGRFRPDPLAASAGSRPRARRAGVAAAALRDDCPRA